MGGAVLACARVEDAAEHLLDELEVAELAADLRLERHSCLSPHRVELGRQRKLDVTRAEIRLLRIVGTVAGRVAGDSTLDLVDVHPADLREPFALGVCGRNARELANRGVVELPRASSWVVNGKRTSARATRIRSRAV